MTELILHANDNDFDELTAANGLVLVDFWAEWCGPCKALAPVLDEIAETYRGEVSVVKVDIVANEATANRLSVQGIPLLVLYRDGKEVDRSVGMLTKSRLAAMIEKQL